MNAFKVSVQIVHSDETLGTSAARLSTFEWLFMLQHVLPESRISAFESAMASFETHLKSDGHFD